MKVEVHIDELILEGLSSDQRQAVAEAIQQALSVLAEQGLPPSFQGERLASLTQTVQPGTRPETIGQQIVQALMVGMRTAPQVEQTGQTSFFGTNAPEWSKT